MVKKTNAKGVVEGYGPLVDMEKVAVGMLHGMKFFVKDYKSGTWRLVEEKAKEWEEKELNKI